MNRNNKVISSGRPIESKDEFMLVVEATNMQKQLKSTIQEISLKGRARQSQQIDRPKGERRLESSPTRLSLKLPTSSIRNDAEVKKSNLEILLRNH